MAETEHKKPDRNDPRRPADNFVARLVPDPAKPPELMRLTGYRGASNQEGHTRLYGNAELSVYWDIPESDVLFEQPVPAETDPLGAVTLWIKRDSQVVSSPAQQNQGGQQPMNAFSGAAAAPQTQAAIFTPTYTLPHSITPLCPSHYYYCPPPSPLVICNHSPLPYCVQPVSPTCPPTHPTIPTLPTIPTYPTTVQTGSLAAGGMQAAPQAMPQAFGAAGQIGGYQLTPTNLQSVIAICPTHTFICQQSHFVYCTIPHTLLCNSPTPICVQPVSPYCPTTPSIPTSIPTTGDPAAGGYGAYAGLGGVQAGFAGMGGQGMEGYGAAPQAQSVQFGAVQPGQLQIQSPVVICYRPSPIVYCYQSLVYWQCHHLTQTPICYYQQVTPNFTPVTTPQTVTQTVATGSPVAGGEFAGGGAAPQAFTITPLTLPTHGTIQTLPTPHTVPSLPTPHTVPTIPTLPTRVTVTFTRVTPVTF
jgi:hypothetical protein